MREYEVLHKQTELTEYELAIEKQNEDNNGFIMKLPLPILSAVTRMFIKRMRKMGLEFKLPEVTVKNNIVKTELQVDVGAGKVSTYFYRRDGANGKRPLFFFIHGGGFLGGTHLANESLLRKLCDEYDIVCASAEYHFAPEVKYPTALRECEAGFMKVLSEYENCIDTDKVYISGDSAGGNLAAALTLLLKRERGFHPAGQVLLYPVINMHTLDTKSYLRQETEFSSMRKGMLLSRRLYGGSESVYKDIYFSPIFTAKNDDPKPTKALFLLAGRDGLLDDGLSYARHLAELGGEAKAIVYDKAFHAFANGLGDSNVASDMYAEIVDFINL